MRLRQTTVLCSVIALGAIIFAVNFTGVAQQVAPRSPDADWPTYNRDPAGTRYSPLTQINTENVSKLTQVWSYRLRPPVGVVVPAVDKPASSFEIFQQVTPIVVNGVMYMPSGNRVVALEPETGREIWSHELSEGLASFRGVAYWPGDGTVPPRILFTSLKKLMALDARTGKLDIEFGTNGQVELDIAYAGVPAIHRNVIIMGSNMFGPGQRHIGPHLTTSKGEIADTHAYDARTGKKLWTFHNIPRPGELGNDTWLNDSWKDRTGNNVWSFTLTVDEQRGLVYLPISGPGMNYYGGDRPGNNLFSNSTVALDIQTGKLKWYFQNIHHEMWDYNLPPAPGLIDIVKDGKTIPALAQVGKSGWMFILNRETGEPVHGVEERPVAKGDVPGEWYPPTQPFPVKPGPVARVSMTEKDLVTAEDTNAEHAQACKEIWDRVKFRNDGPYTPWNYRPNGGPPSVIFPGMTGGVNWGGTATDPKLGYIFVNSKDEPSYGWIQPNPRYNETTKDTEFPYSQVGGGGNLSAQMRDTDGRSVGNVPCFRPPWASLMAVNAATGEFVWRVPLGVNENMPAGKQNVGSPGYGGPMVTAGGLVFIGATRDRRFRAFDSKTGKELWSTRFDYNVTAVPISYQGKDGKQYVAVVAARDGSGGQRIPLRVRLAVDSRIKSKNMIDNRLLYGRAVRDRILGSVAERVAVARAKRPLGRIVSVSIGENKAAAVYVRGQANAARKVGLRFDDQVWPSGLKQDECKARLVAMNDDSDVLGVILQRPVPRHINVRSLASAIHPLKDLEGMNPASIGDIVYNDLALAPCTAAASVELIKETGLDLHGLEVVMIGHSEIVGKPAAFMLMAEGATVTVCHHLTRSVAAHSRRADAVLVAVGKPRFVRADMVKPGAAVIDIGINQIPGPDGTPIIVGDVDTDSVKEIASWVTPVPGGVGPVTVAMFMRNAITAYEKQTAAGWLR